MDKKAKRAQAFQPLAKKPHVFPRRPGMDDIRRLRVREKLRPIVRNFTENLNGILLFAEAGPKVLTARYGDRNEVTESRQVVRKIMNMDRAVRAEVVIKDKQNIAHPRLAVL